jgi:hypothetical protein
LAGALALFQNLELMGRLPQPFMPEEFWHNLTHGSSAASPLHQRPCGQIAPAIVVLIFDSIVAALRRGDKVEIRGFGSFRRR